MTNIFRINRIRILFFAVALFIAIPINAQLREKAKELIESVTTESNQTAVDSAHSDSASILINQKLRDDSIRMQELTLQIQQMKLNEILLLGRLDEASTSNKNDSLKKAEQRRRIDSLRNHTPGVPLIIDEDTLFVIYANRGGLTAHKRAENAKNIIINIGKDYSLTTDSVYVLDSENLSDIMYGDKVVFSVTDQDALWQNSTREALAYQYIPAITKKIIELKKEYNLLKVGKRILFFVLILVIQYALWRLTNYLFRKLRRKISWLALHKLKSITIRDYEFLDTHRQGRVLLFSANLLRYFVILIQLMISVPMLFSIFPQTEAIALQLFNYAFDPIVMIFKKVINYVPNLFIIAIIYFCIKYIVKGLQYIATEIENGKLKITGFFPDWAQPTFNIIRFLLYVFMIAMIYPYLPGADSGVFQGISVFVGLIVSLGSSTAIANIIAGLVITYMRPFKVGDRIKLSDTEGNVIEKTPFVTRIRTPKNEIVTIPNSFIMSSHTTNYSNSAEQYGLIIHSKVTFGYELPREQIIELLINAALATPRVQSNPKPFVLEVELHDYYAVYQINAYIKDADKLAQIYSDLHQSIHDKANEAGIELMSPHYYAQRDGNDIVMPPEFKNKKPKSEK
ncbi:mechanosensitive ion channel family protein [Dysgonomonas sp. 216]|uniref:mechanosensitive ion channel family protein n=1 Tax=Dysgonomonas sp. 216 TaxID=2302934 RepID=UPI0013D20F24|nr:mechanosensitive ion channel family protein [Dysgonomonas sp. 216]NDW17647.1 mechanosensitive ion channel family protein [Dysgonomonas sp. 216]